MENMKELYNIDEIPDSTFTLSFKIIDHYQREDPFLTEKLKCATYQRGYFGGGQDII